MYWYSQLKQDSSLKSLLPFVSETGRVLPLLRDDGLDLSQGIFAAHFPSHNNHIELDGDVVFLAQTPHGLSLVSHDRVDETVLNRQVPLHP